MSRNFMSLSLALFVAAVLIGVAGVAQATLILDLKAADYNPTTGVWTDSSGLGNNATVATTSKPTLVTSGTGVTPNGSSTVYFNGTEVTNPEVLTLLNNINAQQSFTFFAYLQPTADSAGGAILGGTFNSGLGVHPQEWQVNHPDGKQHLAVEYTSEVAHSNTAVPTGAFSSINLQISGYTSPTGAFRYNGSGDGGGSATGTFTGNINSVGGFWHTNNSGWYQQLRGYVAEIRIYNDVTVDRPTVEGQFTAAYVTPVPEPSTLALLAAGLAGLLCYAWRRRR